VKADEMGVACITYDRVEYAYKNLFGKRERKNHSEDLDVDWKIILE
jgi:hypothetical protein